MSWVQVIYSVTLNNVIPSNNLLLNSYFRNLTVELYFLYVLNICVNFYTNQTLFIILSINSSFMHYFKLQKVEFKQLIDDITINLWLS